MKNILIYLSLIISTVASANSFVRVKDGQLYRANAPYYFMGTNFWQAMNLAHRDPARLNRELDRLKDMGVTNLRILALSEGPDTEPYRVTPAMITKPSELKEELLVAMDRLLVEMKKRNMTAVMVLSNFWPWSGGFAQWVSWYEKNNIPYPPPHPGGSWSTFQDYSSRFYTIPEAVKAQQALVAKLVSRTNSLTKVAYKDDDTIMSWQLANEPRGGKFRKEFLAWISSSAKMIKRLDPNHLVSVGSEGDTLSAESAGNHFLEDHAIAEIDYTTVHVWVENWGIYDPNAAATTMSKAQDLLRNYIKSHLERSRAMGKPMILEEFGMARDKRSMQPSASTTDRDAYYRVAFEETLSQLTKGLSGVNFWAWSGESRPREAGGLWRTGDDLLGDPPHEEQGWYGVYDRDSSTLKLIKEFSEKINKVKKALTKTLFISDSHGEGAYGNELKQLVEADGETFVGYAYGGTEPGDWLKGTLMRWGFWQYHSQEYDRRGEKQPTPLLEKLLIDHEPANVLISLGTNLIWRDLQLTDAQNIQSLIRLVNESGARCFWIGSPDLDPRKRSEAHREQEIHRLLEEELRDANCELIRSWEFTHYPERRGDGIHYDAIPSQGTALAQRWAQDVFSRIKD